MSDATVPATAGGLLLSFAWAGLFCACAQAPLNARLPHALTEAAVNRERPLPPGRSDDLLVVLSFSGGGVRAAALATFSSEHVRALDAQSIDVVILQFDCHDGVISRLQVASPR